MFSESRNDRHHRISDRAATDRLRDRDNAAGISNTAVNVIPCLTSSWMETGVTLFLRQFPKGHISKISNSVIYIFLQSYTISTIGGNCTGCQYLRAERWYRCIEHRCCHVERHNFIVFQCLSYLSSVPRVVFLCFMRVLQFFWRCENVANCESEAVENYILTGSLITLFLKDYFKMSYLTSTVNTYLSNK